MFEYRVIAFVGTIDDFELEIKRMQRGRWLIVSITSEWFNSETDTSRWTAVYRKEL